MSWSSVVKSQSSSFQKPLPKKAGSAGSSKQQRLNNQPGRPVYPSTSRNSKHHQAPRPPIQVNLITNAYSIQTRQLNTTIHEYSLHVTLSEGYRDISPQVLFRNFVSRGIRKTIVDQLIPQLLGPNYSRGTVVIEQNLEAIYSAKPFEKQTISNEETSPESPGMEQSIFKFKNIHIKADLLCRICVDVTFKFTRTFPFDSSFGLNFTLINSILHHQLWLTMLKYGAVYFLSKDKHRLEPGGQQDRQDPRRLDLMSEHVMGISLSGIRQTVSNQAIVVIHCPHSYITRSHRLIDLLASFIRGCPIRGVQLLHAASDQTIRRSGMKEIQDISGSEQWFRELCSILDGFKCKAEGPQEAEGLSLRFNLTNETASELPIQDPSVPGKIVTVQEYYRNLGINLNYPNLPCLKSRSPRHPYYPFEMCSLLPDQKVPIFRLSLTARNHLNFINKPRPELAYRSSYDARNNIESIVQNELKSFGVSLSQVSVEAQGSILNKPTLQFKNQLVEPERDHWESGQFYQSVDLFSNWCVVNTVEIDFHTEDAFFGNFSQHSERYGFKLGQPHYINRSKAQLLENENTIVETIEECHYLTQGHLRLIVFVIDSCSSQLNRLIHLSFDDYSNVTATCLRLESIMNVRQHRSIFRTLGHKLNARLGGTNVVYHNQTLERLDLNVNELMIIGLDVTHPDNELKGFSIVGCAYTYSPDLFKHRSLVWPQAARVEIIGKLDVLLKRILQDYYRENNKRFPGNIIVYRDGVSHEEFDRVREVEVERALKVLVDCSKEKHLPKPNLSYIIAQKRHTMRFFQLLPDNICSNPPSGTLIDQDIVTTAGKEFYLYSTTSPQATARPLHYHVLLDQLSFDKLQKLTYFLCFNFGKCSGSLSMPSSLKYAHNAAYDARNRVIASREFSENKFYTSKFFC